MCHRQVADSVENNTFMCSPDAACPILCLCDFEKQGSFIQTMMDAKYIQHNTSA